MAMNYNRFPRPAVITVYRGQPDVIVMRESYEDLIRNDVIPARLQREETRSRACVLRDSSWLSAVKEPNAYNNNAYQYRF